MNNINKKGRIPVLCILLLILLLAYSHAAAIGEPIQDCHKVTSTATTTTQKNKSKVRLWHVETACEPVTEEINGIAEGWAEEAPLPRRFPRCTGRRLPCPARPPPSSPR